MPGIIRMTDSEHETGTHEVASRTPPEKAGMPPDPSQEDVPRTALSVDADPVETEGKPHQIKPDGR